MTKVNATTCATDFDDTVNNAQLMLHGFTIRHIETWHRDGYADSIILWDRPVITEADLPF